MQEDRPKNGPEDSTRKLEQNEATPDRGPNPMHFPGKGGFGVQKHPFSATLTKAGKGFSRTRENGGFWTPETLFSRKVHGIRAFV